MYLSRSPWLLAVCLFIYVFYRAATLSFTHDEALSYTIVQGVDVYTQTANHHWLNTVLMGVCSQLFGDAEWSLRLPNVLSFGVYALAVIGILRFSKQTWIQLIGAALLLGNPLLIEFFSLARGYGLSIAWMTAAIYFLLAPKSSARRFLIHALLCMVCMSSALAAGLSVINVYIMVMGLLGLRAVQQRNTWRFSKREWGVLFLLMLVALVPLIPAVQRLVFLKEHNELYFGTDNLFFTFESLIKPVIASDNSVTIATFAYSLIGLSLLVVIDLLIRRSFKGRLLTSVFLLGGVLMGAVLEHFLFDAFYAIERAALYLVPLFGILFFFALVERYDEAKTNNWKYAAGIGIVALTTFHFIDTKEINTTHTWHYDRNTKDAVLLMNSLCKEDEKCTVGNFWLFKPVLNYYIDSRQLHLQAAQDNSDGQADLVYQYTRGFDAKGYRMVKYYPNTGTAVYVRMDSE